MTIWISFGFVPISPPAALPPQLGIAYWLAPSWSKFVYNTFPTNCIIQQYHCWKLSALDVRIIRFEHASRINKHHWLFVPSLWDKKMILRIQEKLFWVSEESLSLEGVAVTTVTVRFFQVKFKCLWRWTFIRRIFLIQVTLEQILFV